VLRGQKQHERRGRGDVGSPHRRSVYLRSSCGDSLVCWECVEELCVRAEGQRGVRVEWVGGNIWCTAGFTFISVSGVWTETRYKSSVCSVCSVVQVETLELSRVHLETRGWWR